MSDKARVRVFVSGIVQGVFFRVETERTARESGNVTGWIRNTEDGGVEAVFEGEKENIEKMIAWMKKGPPLARVEKIDVIRENYKGEFKNFDIRH